MPTHYERRGAEQLANSITAGNQFSPLLTYLPDGRFVVGWTDASTSNELLRGQIYNADGSKSGPEISLAPLQQASNQELKALFTLADGSFVTVWSLYDSTFTDSDVFARRYSADGLPIGAEFSVNSQKAGQQSAYDGTALAGGGFLISWIDYSGDPDSTAFTASRTAARAQLFDPAGAKLGGEIFLNTATPGAQFLPVAGALADGGWISVWADNGAADAIVAQRFAADGSRIGAEFVVDQTIAGLQRDPSIGMLPGGGFVIAWRDDSHIGGDSSLSAVKARLFDSSGAPSGDEFLVNSTTAGSQTYPKVAVTADGGFVIAWREETGLDGSGYNVRAQAFDSAGARIDGELAVNGSAPGHQYLNSVAASADGFTVAWTDYDSAADGSGSAIKFRHYSASTAGEGADTVTGTDGDDDISGFGGDDVLSGLGGNDALDGGAGDDRLDGGLGDDRLVAGTGTDRLDGGTGNDRLVFVSAETAGIDEADGGTGIDVLEASFAAAGRGMIVADGWAGTADGRVLEFTGIERLELTLSEFGDDATGGSGDDILLGLGGDDSLAGGDGNDRLDGGAGADRMTGGAGDDTYVVDSSADSVAEQANGGTDTVVTGLASYALGRNVENLTGTGSAQRLTGNALDNVVSGLGGDDRIEGGLGNDKLYGGDGNDRVEDRSGGDDLLDGGEGDDRISVVHYGWQRGTGATLLGGNGNDSLYFDGAVNATIDSGAGDDRVEIAYAAHTNITLGLGADTLAFDSFQGGAVVPNYVADFKVGAPELGGDRLDLHTLFGRAFSNWDQSTNPFASGRARLDVYQGYSVISLNTKGYWEEAIQINGRALSFTEYNLGGFLASFSAVPQNRVLDGTESTDKLYGGAGSDTISGLGGDDRIEGGFGSDILAGGAGDDYLNGQTGDDILQGGTGNDTLEDHAGGGDTLNGGEGDDFISVSRTLNMVARTVSIDGGAGDDLIWYDWIPGQYESPFDRNGGAVSISAGTGADTVVIWDRRGSVGVDLGDDDVTDVLRFDSGGRLAETVVAHFTAGDGGDRLDLADYLAADLAGWDQQTNPFATGYLALVGDSTGVRLMVDPNGGADAFVPLVTFTGIAAGSLTAWNLGGYSADGSAPAGTVAAGGAGDDTLTGGVGGDTLSGLGGDDVISGGNGADTIDGGDGEDRLAGGGGDDVVDAGAGDDLIEESVGGADRLSGGAGNDDFVLSRAATAAASTLQASGGDGDDRFDVTASNGSALALDGGSGDDRITFFALKGSATVTLGSGQDVIRLDPGYFGPYTNQTRVKEIVVTDFATGAGGDRIDINDAAAYGIGWHTANDYRTGLLRLLQSGSDTLLQYSYSTSYDYQTLFRFKDRSASDFTADNLGSVLPQTIVVAAGSGDFVNHATVFGMPAARIVADNVTFTNASGAFLEAAHPALPGSIGAAIKIEGAGVTIVNESGAKIAGELAITGYVVPTDAPAIIGSDHDDTVINRGEILGTIRFGAGNDRYFAAISGATNGNNPLPIDFGDGDDSAEFDMNGSKRFSYGYLTGGAGHDKVVFQNIIAGTTFDWFNISGIEELRLNAAAPGATAAFSVKPAVDDVYLSPGLTFTVNAVSSSTGTAYNLPAFGTVHLEGGNFTTGLNAAFAGILGTDAAETVILLPTALTPTVAVGNIALGGGDDSFTLGTRNAMPGHVDGGAGYDDASVGQFAAALNLSALTGFEKLSHSAASSTSVPAYSLTGIGAEAELLLLQTNKISSTVTLSGLATPSLTVGAGATRTIVAADSIVGRIDDRGLVDVSVAAPLAQDVENRGTVTGGANLGGGNDILVNSGSFGGDVLLGTGDDAFTAVAGSSVAGAVFGGAGNDVYTIGAAGYSIVEQAGEGTDEVRTALASYTLPDNVENFVGTSSIGQVMAGNGLDNVLTMGAGNDVLNLSAGGNDMASGGAGDDYVYFGAAFTADDVIVGGAGTDTVGLLGNYNLTLGANTLSGVETFSLLSGTAAGGTEHVTYSITTVDANVSAGGRLTVYAGGLLADESLFFNGYAETDGALSVYGGAGNDTFAGGPANDAFVGGAGDDTMYGLGGMDWLEGGLGADTMRGGPGNDVFVYQSAAESTAAKTDRIVDFEYVSDHIVLTNIDANANAAGDQAFSFIGSNAFSHTAGELRAYQSGASWFVEGDVDGDGVADLVIQVDTAANHAIIASDFLL